MPCLVIVYRLLAETIHRLNKSVLSDASHQLASDSDAPFYVSKSIMSRVHPIDVVSLRISV